MPELIRLQTPDFEFSVWANDISQRVSLYQSTVANRASLTANVNTDAALKTPFDFPLEIEGTEVAVSADHVRPSYVLRFAPAAELNNIIEPQGLVATGLDENALAENGPAGSGLAVNSLAKHAELTLNSP